MGRGATMVWGVRGGHKATQEIKHTYNLLDRRPGARMRPRHSPADASTARMWAGPRLSGNRMQPQANRLLLLVWP